MFFLKCKHRSLLVSTVMCIMATLSSGQATADSFFDKGKVYTIFGFTFCFPACPYVSADVRFPKYAVVDPPLPR
jgi:hypothetical protein